MVIRNLDHLHQGLVELKRSTSQMNPTAGRTSQATGRPPQVAAAAGQSTHITVKFQPTDIRFHHSNGCRLAEVTTGDLQMLQLPEDWTPRKQLPGTL